MASQGRAAGGAAAHRARAGCAAAAGHPAGRAGRAADGRLRAAPGGRRRRICSPQGGQPILPPTHSGPACLAPAHTVPSAVRCTSARVAAGRGTGCYSLTAQQRCTSCRGMQTCLPHVEGVVIFWQRFCCGQGRTSIHSERLSMFRHSERGPDLVARARGAGSADGGGRAARRAALGLRGRRERRRHALRAGVRRARAGRLPRPAPLHRRVPQAAAGGVPRQRAAGAAACPTLPCTHPQAPPLAPRTCATTPPCSTSCCWRSSAPACSRRGVLTPPYPNHTTPVASTPR